MPYIVVILAILIAAIISLAFSRSFRNYRKKLNILIYFTIILALGLLMFQMDNVSRRAQLNYSIGTSQDKAYVGQINQIVCSCGNAGGRVAEFYLIVNAANASILLQSQQDYILLSNTTVKIPFSIPGSSGSKPVFYTVEDNVSSFSFSASIENRGGALDVLSAIYDVTYVWNATDGYYTLKGISGFT